MDLKRFYFPLLAISLLTLITALAAVLRAWQTNESLWIDELHTSWVVSDDADSIAGRAAVGNQSPLFFYVVKASTFGFGMTELALRLPSLIAGMALVPLVFFACARWTKSTCAGLFAAVVVALEQPPHRSDSIDKQDIMDLSGRTYLNLKNGKEMILLTLHGT